MVEITKMIAEQWKQMNEYEKFKYESKKEEMQKDQERVTKANRRAASCASKDLRAGASPGKGTADKLAEDDKLQLKITRFTQKMGANTIPSQKVKAEYLSSNKK